MFSVNTKTDYKSLELSSSMKLCALFSFVLLIILIIYHLCFYWSVGHLYLLAIAAFVNLIPIIDVFIISKLSVIERLKKLKDKNNFFMMKDIELARKSHHRVTDLNDGRRLKRTADVEKRVREYLLNLRAHRTNPFSAVKCSSYSRNKLNVNSSDTVLKDKEIAYHLLKIKDNSTDFIVDKHEDTDRVYIGRGYEFTPDHARLLKKLLEKGLTPLRKIGSGSSQIQNLSKRKDDLFIKTSALSGHTLIFGTTGSGKTKLFELLISQAIERNEVVIVIDPKGDLALKHKMARICEASLRSKDFSVLDLKTLENTTRPFDLFASNPSPSAIADRLCTLMKNKANDHDPFADYAYDAIRASIIATTDLNQPITLLNIKRNIRQECFFEALLLSLVRATLKSQDKKSAIYLLRVLKGLGHATILHERLYELAGIYDKEKLNSEGTNDQMTQLLSEFGCNSSLAELMKVSTGSEVLQASFADGESKNCSKKCDEKDNEAITANDKLQQKDGSSVQDKEQKAESVSCENSSDGNSKCAAKKVTRRTSKMDASKVTDNQEPSTISAKKSTKSTSKKPAKPKALSISAKVQILSQYYRYFLENTSMRFDQNIDLLLRQSCLNPEYYLKITAGIGPILNVLSNDGIEDVICASGNNLTFREIYIKNKVMYCSIPSMSNSSLTKYVGRLLLADLCSFASNINAQEKSKKNDLNADDTGNSKLSFNEPNDEITVNHKEMQDQFKHRVNYHKSEYGESSESAESQRQPDKSLRIEQKIEQNTEDMSDKAEYNQSNTREDHKNIEDATIKSEDILGNNSSDNKDYADPFFEEYEKSNVYSDNYLSSLTKNLCPSVVQKILKEQDDRRKRIACDSYKKHDLEPKRHVKTDYLKLPVRRRVNIFIDEASEIVNEPMLQLLNKSRSAGFAITVATQTFADLATRCGSAEAAKQLIGNCNNLISLRVGDDDTAAILSSSLPSTTYQGYNTSIGTNSDSSSLNIKDTTTRSTSSTEDSIFPPSVMLCMPNFEYVAKLSDGRFVKGVFPYLAEVDGA